MLDLNWHAVEIEQKNENRLTQVIRRAVWLHRQTVRFGSYRVLVSQHAETGS